MLKFLRNQRGGMAVYTAMLTLVGLGAGAAAIDFGRLEVLRSEMQNAADAAALSGAVFLLGQPGSRAEAEDVIRNAMSHKTNVTSLGGSVSLTVASVNFYSDYANKTPGNDLDAKAVEVTLVPQTVDLLLSPILNFFAPTASTMTLNASAAAGVNPFMCNVPPMMLCDLAEQDPALDPTLTSNIGRLIRMKAPLSGGGAWAPGNFGLLSLPDGSSGAQAVSDALAADTPAGCYQLNVITATGQKSVPVADGLNTRFDLVPGATEPAAPNVINYPQDGDLLVDPALVMGNGVWDIAGYWAAKHNGAAVPVDLTNASRYQAYLYELGVTFARNGKQTIYPIPNGSLPVGFTAVTPPVGDNRAIIDPAQAGNDLDIDGLNDGLDPDFDGVPATDPPGPGPARRVIRAALLQCQAENVTGKGEYPTFGKYVTLFLTQEVRTTGPDKGGVYAEIIKSVDLLTEELHANAGLLD